MEDFYSGAVTRVMSVMDQISALNWALILSGVGIVEGVRGSLKRRGKAASWAWTFPLILGALIGIVTYVADFGKNAVGLQYFAKVCVSALMYCGWVTLAYFITLRPIKYLGDWAKRKSQGEQNGNVT